VAKSCIIELKHPIFLPQTSSCELSRYPLLFQRHVEIGSTDGDASKEETMNKIVLRILVLALLVTAIAACGAGERDSEATEEPSPSPTAVPTEPPSPTPTETSEPEVLDAVVVGDTTTVVAGEAFIATWRIQNAGTVDWDDASGEFRWAFVGGDRLEGPDVVPIVGVVPVGQVYEISAEFTAPATPGQYEAMWQLQDPAGQPVGPVFYTSLNVEESPGEVTEDEPVEETPEPVEETPEPVEDEESCLDSYPVSDVTMPDGTVVEPGETFTKIWRIRNTGTCAWDEADGEYTWVFTGGYQMGGPDEIPISGTVDPGGEYDVEIVLTAPTTPGEYRGNWQLYDPSGNPFGVPYWVLIEVQGAGSAPSSGSQNPAYLVWQNINGERARAGLAQLAYSDLLAQAAQIQADDCSQRGDCSHTGSDGSDETIRAARLGYVGSVDEAWAMAASTADAVQWWMDEPVWHRPLLLSDFFTEVGVGIAPASSGQYYIAVFGARGR
jgi:hypothetical protein